MYLDDGEARSTMNRQAKLMQGSSCGAVDIGLPERERLEAQATGLISFSSPELRYGPGYTVEALPHLR